MSLKIFIFLLLVLLTQLSEASETKDVEQLLKAIEQLNISHADDLHTNLESALKLKEEFNINRSVNAKSIYLGYLVSLYIELSDLTNAEEYYNKLTSIPIAVLDIKAQALRYLSEGVFFTAIAKNQDAEQVLLKMIKIARRENFDELLFDGHAAISALYEQTRNFELALSSLQTAYKLSTEFQSALADRQRQYVSNRLANLYVFLGKPDRALLIYQKTLDNIDKKNNIADLATLHYNIGNIYRRQSRFDDATEHLKKAFHFALQAKDDLTLAYSIYGQSMVSYSQGDWEQAIANAERAKKLFSRIKKPIAIADTESLLGNAFLKLKQSDKSLEYFLLAKEKYIDAGDKEALQLLDENLYFIYKEQKQYKTALTHLETSYTLYKEQYNQEKAKIVESMQSEFEAERNAYEKKMLQQKNTIQKIKIEQQNIENRDQYHLFIFSLLIAFILSVIVGRLIISERKLRNYAKTDSLTQILNRRYIMKVAEQELSRAKRYDFELSLIIFDIDFFKKINDTFGHSGGDNVLKKISEICASTIRNQDIIGRLGGEEFLVVLPHASSIDAMKSAERMRKNIESLSWSEIMSDSQGLHITASFGVAELRKSNESIQDLIENADSALYRAKESGRNRSVNYSEVIMPRLETKIHDQVREYHS